MLKDTICSIITAKQESAVSIIRISGENVFNELNLFFSGFDITTVKANSIVYGYFIDSNKEIVDEILVSKFIGPKSFTAENTIEINCHGGIFVTNKILKILLNSGIRHAEPGEFTKRAFLNGRIDLVQAESVMDIIKSKNDKALQLAGSSLRGRTSSEIKAYRDNLLNLIAHLEVNIDYPEYDDVEELLNEQIKPKVIKLYDELKKIYKKSLVGSVVTNGIDTAIIGKPNVGKSSLLNYLSNEEKAIVTDISGTTRDVIESEVNMGNYVLNLIDTAGIRKTNDVVESIGIEKSYSMIEKAQLVLLVIDNSTELDEKDLELLSITEEKNRIIILNKSDIRKANKLEGIEFSTISGIGMEELNNKIEELFSLNLLSDKEFTSLTNLKHISYLEQALQNFKEALNAINNGLESDMIELDLKEAFYNLGLITGETSETELLDKLFSQFCLGK